MGRSATAELVPARRLTVVDAFGPTVQGEGPLAGRVTHFLRLGGCDYRCQWCDTMEAVDPARVRQAPRLDPAEILDRLDALAPAPMLVISGGNPALWTLDELLAPLRQRYRTLTVETQGSVWRDWLMQVDSLVISPKPPSSGMATERHARQFFGFMDNACAHAGAVLKIVIFDDADLEWASQVHSLYAGLPLYLSAGTPQDEADYHECVSVVGERYRWLCEAVTADRRLHGAVVLPQLHVVAWGHRVGV